MMDDDDGDDDHNAFYDVVAVVDMRIVFKIGHFILLCCTAAGISRNEKQESIIPLILEPHCCDRTTYS